MNALRPAHLAALLLLLAVRPVFGSITAQRRSFDPQLSVEILTGYPFDARDPRRQSTLGFVFHNFGGPRQIRIVLSGELAVSREVAVPGGETARLFLYLPLVSGLATLGFNDLDLVDVQSGQRVSSTVPPYAGGTANPDGFTLARIGAMDSAINVTRPWSDLGVLEPGSDLPDDWRGVAGVRLLLVEQRRLRDAGSWWPVVAPWIDMGGSLVIVRDDDAEPLALPPLPFASPWAGAIQRAGLGQVAIVDRHDVAMIDADFTFVAPAFKLTADENLAQTVVSDQLGIRSGARWQILVALVLYSLLVGPIAWWFLVGTRRRPFAYLGSVFTIAPAFCAALMGSSFWIYGVTPIALTRSVRFVDQRLDAEMIFDEAFVFAPATWNSTLRAGRSTAFLVNPRGIDDFGTHTARLALGVDGELLDGVVPVRRPAQVGRRGIRPLRGRLVVDQSGGLRVENHLGHHIAKLLLWYEGVPYEIRDIGRGERREVGNRVGSDTFYAFGAASFLAESEPLARRLREGQLGGRLFIAELAGDPDPILERARLPQPGNHLVLGVYQ